MHTCSSINHQGQASSSSIETSIPSQQGPQQLFPQLRPQQPDASLRNASSPNTLPSKKPEQQQHLQQVALLLYTFALK